MGSITVNVKNAKVEASLQRIEALLQQILQAQQTTTERGKAMADTLDDVRANLQELNVDVDTAVSSIADLREQVADALANAGVDEAARAEINATIDGIQQKVFNALNPAVPVDPADVEPVDPGFFPPGVVAPE